ncbi:hypothetical protein ACMU_09320 [Actibacterium mucosum KCTC 23349]|uniref:Uncharacterized protein n=1 Tax=Actibacterium mucosum KCTC 23349 TaxID=1454373 RepID=A0A037ZHQ7_9RHOB|nr:hypothetical protein [Actibacterium mucosum]KAJ55955.1 hypothetical protein ACMU_09320 [Actibacterium mucosum KCTC 23349]
MQWRNPQYQSRVAAGVKNAYEWLIGIFYLRTASFNDHREGLEMVKHLKTLFFSTIFCAAGLDVEAHETFDPKEHADIPSICVTHTNSDFFGVLCHVLAHQHEPKRTPFKATYREVRTVGSNAEFCIELLKYKTFLVIPDPNGGTGIDDVDEITICHD